MSHILSIGVDVYSEYGPHTWAQAKFRVDCGGAQVYWTNDPREISEIIKQCLPGVET